MILRSTGCIALPDVLVPDALFAVPPQAANVTIAATAETAFRLIPCIDCFSSLNWYFAADSTGSPFDEPVFERADESLRDQGEYCQDEHAREHTVDVEGVPGVVDELAEACGGSKELADHGADDGQPKADVAAAGNPGPGRRAADLRRQPAVVRAIDAAAGAHATVALAD